MIPINLAAAIFAVIVGVMLTACVILCIMAQLLFQRCLRILTTFSTAFINRRNFTMREQNNEDWLKAAEERMKEHAQIPKLIKKLKLKPCPFCGYNAGISEPGEDVCRSDRYSVGCVYHACIVQPKITYGRGAYFSEIPELAKVWNKRSKRVEQENDA